MRDHGPAHQATTKPGFGETRKNLLARADVLLHRGRFSLVNTELTPHQAMQQDLLFLREVLDQAGIEYLLVRGDDSRPVLAVDRDQRLALAAAVTAAMVDEPFYVTVLGKKKRITELVADGGLKDLTKARQLRFYRPRVEPVGGLAYGNSAAVLVQLWKFGKKQISAPAPTAVTRERTSTTELLPAKVSRYGLEWRTVADMFAARPTDVDFDIDLVFSWVDGSSVEWQRARAKRMAAYVVGEGDDSEARFRQLDELKYALRSVHLFAPWIRNVYIVTDSPRPAWLAEQDRVTVVPSEEFFADPSVLPTHNSQAVESQLHHIPGISEHFLYSNDDMFFGRPVDPEMFYTAGGVTSFLQSPLRIGLGANNPERSGFENSARVNREVIRRHFGIVIDRHLEHAPVPLRKSVLEEMERTFPDEFARTAASRFRAMENISVTNSLYHYYALLTGRATINTTATFSYVDTTSRAGLIEMNDLLNKRQKDFFCLNDGSFPEISAEERADAIGLFLERYFPIAAPWERTTAAAEPSTGDAQTGN